MANNGINLIEARGLVSVVSQETDPSGGRVILKIAGLADARPFFLSLALFGESVSRFLRDYAQAGRSGRAPAMHIWGSLGATTFTNKQGVVLPRVFVRLHDFALVRGNPSEFVLKNGETVLVESEGLNRVTLKGVLGRPRRGEPATITVGDVSIPARFGERIPDNIYRSLPASVVALGALSQSWEHGDAVWVRDLSAVFTTNEEAHRLTADASPESSAATTNPASPEAATSEDGAEDLDLDTLLKLAVKLAEGL